MWLKNLPLKITAVGLALLLWFHVATNREYDHAVSIQLKTAPLPSAFALAQPIPDHIRVLVTGTGKELIRLIWEDAHAALLVEPWMDSSLVLSPDRLLLNSDADVQVKQVIEPSTLRVHVDTLVEQNVRVRFQGEYTTGAGVSLERVPQVVPEQVTLRGPRAAVSGLTSVGTEPMSMRLLTESVSQEVPLDLGERYNVTVDPQHVTVQFKVATAVVRDISGIPVQAPRGWVVDPRTVTLSVSGAQARLDSLGPEFYRAAVTPRENLDHDSLISVEATVPTLVEILAVAPDRVRVYRR